MLNRRNRARVYRPNAKSVSKTPASLAIDLHYAHLRIQQRWDEERYDRLCVFLNLTRAELASFVCWTHSSMENRLPKNEVPAPVGLLLTLLEAQVMRKFSTDIIPNPFPNGQHPTS